jgi:predicted outer membrane protein
MKIRSLFFACALASSPLAVADRGATPSSETAKLSDVDTQVVAHLHAVDQLEIALGKLAEQNGTAGVKTFGQMLVTDHTAFDAKLAAFAKQHGMPTIPADASQSAAAKTELDAEKGKLAALHGEPFDHELLPMMAKAHDQELTKVDANIAIVSDPELKSMLLAVKPVLQSHADEARRLQLPVSAAR